MKSDSPSLIDPDMAHRKKIRAWAMYDFSTQGYQVTTASALFPPYFAKGIAPEGAILFGIHFPASALWGYGIGFASACVFLLAPILGAIADGGGYKRRFMMSFAYPGCLFASLLFFAQPGMVWYSLIFFVCAQICYTSGNVFYDSFLPHIASPKEMDRVSGLGFAFGYLGGTLQFSLALLLVSAHEWFGISEVLSIRLSLLMAGLWWFGFSLYTFRHLKEVIPQKVLPIKIQIKQGVHKTWSTIRQIPRFPATMLFLAAFFFYNDGIQTIISVSGLYASDTLQLSTQVIMITFLIVQFVAVGGAFLFSILANFFGTKYALILGLLAWCLIVTKAYFLQTGDYFNFMLLGAFIGLILGGTQALSRSLFASIVPEKSSAGFFGFYSIFNKLSAIAGPIAFGTISMVFNSSRPAILMLVVFFLVGTILLLNVDLEKARASKHLWKT